MTFRTTSRTLSNMEIITATEARSSIYNLIAQIRETHQPVQIKTKTGNVVMLSQEDWNAIQETLYLDSIPGMTDSMIKGMKSKNKNCKDSLETGLRTF